MHGKIVDAMAVMNAKELREVFRESLEHWKDDMVKLLFNEAE